jgi:EAL domain-containing protein (putative c-di-GMP-specific phosphodiesterase class I)
LLQNLRGESPEKGIITAILAIAQSLNRRVVATGVETEAQGEILRQLNCKIVQGAWVSGLLSVEEMTAFIRDRV